MGIREVKIYTCDGCKATATLDRNTQARGWHNVKVGAMRGDIGTKLLCTVCYAAVEWVVKFQGITVPPKAFKGVDGRYRLRKQTLADFPHQLGSGVEEDEADLLDDDEDDEEL